MSENRVYTFSQLSLYQTCPRKYYYKYVLKLDTVFDGVPLPAGKALHHGLDIFYEGNSMEAATEEANTSYWEELRPIYDSLDFKEQTTVDNGWLQVQAMLANYPYKDRGELISSEQAFQIDMGHGRDYRGKLDRIMNSNGMLWVHDTKTTGMDMAKIIKAHRLRKQFAGYKLLGDALLPTTSENPSKLPISGVIADVIYKPRVYNRKDGTVTIQAPLYHREPIHVAESDTADFTHWFHKIANDIEGDEDDMRLKEEACPSDPIPYLMNNGSCLNFNRICPFYEGCRNPDRAAEYFDAHSNYVTREMLHPEYK